MNCSFVLVLLLIAQLLSFASYILIAPFLPPEFARKGVSPAMIGAVFAGQSVTSTLFSPVVGKYLDKTGSRVWLIGGFFLYSICFASFGICDNIESPLYLGLVGILIRMLQGLAMAAISTACYSLATNN